MTATAGPAQPPIPGHEPTNRASPKAKTPPSAPTMKYPAPSVEGTMATMGAARGCAPEDPAGENPSPGSEP